MTGLRNMHEAADWLGISWETLRKMASARQVPCTKIGAQIRFTQAHLDAIVAAGEQQVATAPTRATVTAIRAAATNPPTTPPTTPPPPAAPRTPPPPAGPKRSDGQRKADAA